MPKPYHKVFIKYRKPNGEVCIHSNNVRGKSAQTRWLNAMIANNPGYERIDSWTLNDGRGLGANGERVPS